MSGIPDQLTVPTGYLLVAGLFVFLCESSPGGSDTKYIKDEHSSNV
jgi:hypothetical protein